MYLPAHFDESNREALHRLIVEHPFGILVTGGDAGPDANHLPFELDPAVGANGLLRAHVARANPLWREPGDGADVLVIFRAEHGYISPNWYPGKLEHHKAVPTWNYRVVHAHGRLAIRDDEKFLRGLVGRLTRRHEAAQPDPWKMGDAPRDYIDSMLAQIVGLEIEITRLVGKFKLSQNREARDRRGAAEGAERQGNTALADAMREADPE